jgi:tetratricopeptide (TPR) repeat protein
VLTYKRNFEYKNIFIYWKSNINNFPEGEFVYNNLAATFYSTGNIQGAKTYCWINLMVNSNQPNVWYNLGQIYLREGKFVQARDCFLQALDIDKDYAPARNSLKFIEEKLKQKRK